MVRAKSPELRQRRNKRATAATLIADAGPGAVPNLPAGIKRKETRAWWKAIWESPMAAEWLEADRQALLRLAVLVDLFWTMTVTPLSPVKELIAEIAKQEARFGLTPYDRHRMDWKVEAAPEKPAVAAAAGGVDPRTLLRAVK